MTPDKRRVLEELLREGAVMVHVDTRREGVAVPSRFEGHPHLPLRLDLRFNLPVFEIDDDGVVAALSFRGQRFTCVLPWPAVFAMNADPGGVPVRWPDDFPAELIVEEPTGRADATRPELRLVGDEAGDEGAPSIEPVDPPAPPEPKTGDENLPVPVPGPVLRAVEPPPPEDIGETPPEPDDDPEPPKRPHLRLVK